MKRTKLSRGLAAAPKVDIQALADAFDSAVGNAPAQVRDPVRDLLGRPVSRSLVQRSAANYAELLEAGRLVCRELPDGSEILQVEKTFAPAVKAVDASARTVDVITSTDQVDWYGDTLNVAGWDYRSAYNANPVVLLDHAYVVDAIVGRSVKLWADQDVVKAATEDDADQVVNLAMSRDLFDPEGTNASADMAFAKIQNLSLRAVSVGFIPLEWTRRESGDEDDAGGFDFVSQAKLEHSWVAVPANPGATIPNGKSGAANLTVPPATADRAVTSDKALELLAKTMLLATTAGGYCRR